MKRFEGKVAVVTGGASGIGEAIVRSLLEEGARVAVLDRNAERLAEQQREWGADFYGVAGDVTDEADVAHCMIDCVERLGALDLAFNVAGAAKSGPLIEYSLEDWDF